MIYEATNIYTGPKRIAQADETAWQAAAGLGAWGLPGHLAQEGSLDCFWVRFANQNPQGLGSFHVQGGNELKLHYSIAGPGLISIQDFFQQSELAGVVLAANEWHLLGFGAYDTLWVNGTRYKFPARSYGYFTKTTPTTQLGRTYRRWANVWMDSDAVFGSYFRIEGGTNEQRQRFMTLAYNNGRGCDMRLLPGYSMVTHHMDFSGWQVEGANTRILSTYKGIEWAGNTHPFLNTASPVTRKRIGRI